MINSASDVNSAYMNFLRCVKAIATAASGTSSLTVNPFTNNTGTIDSTRNCIVSIDANTEAGGWTESTSSNVVQSGSFTAIASAASALYKFDAYVGSGKGSLPYLKMSFHAATNTSTSGSLYGNGAIYGNNYNQFASYPFIQMTFGASTSTDWTSTTYIPTTSGYPNYTGQTTSWTMNAFGPNSSNTPANGHPMFWANNPTVNYRMAVTANYCIIWEVHTSNSYLTGFANQFTTVPTNFINNSFGGLMYGGLRETQSWENSRADNPPWVAMQLYHVLSGAAQISGGSTTPYPPQNVCAYMAAVNDSGVPSATATKYFSNNTYTTEVVLGADSYTAQTQTGTGSGIGAGSQTVSQGLYTPLFHARDSRNLAVTNQLYMPTVDTTTGTGVPSAFPIMIRRSTTGSWNPGGAIRGLYKSLSMPIATMKNYFANGQTFSIYNNVTATTDTYIPIVFNETMYLVRYA